ncbi:DNA repair nucleotidyltransferase [Serinibacter arcticus]|uniref:DNA repair nucleotidyltransferase n=1 Tax=Serinibacter arcticus TaxID=1655435 RepID=A0A2U1ZRJ2_9MICO|nr:DNA polymerase Y family protein [Serinibacter arcticus]PWD49571.1 DNA repair nucleotidyltransferase [Serinibacter arcticus]
MASLPIPSDAARPPLAAVPVPSRSAERAPRLGVLWVPDWPVAAAALEGQLAVDRPVAVHDARGVLAASAPARALGVRRGMRRRAAQEICPELVLVPTDTGRDVRAFEPLVQACEHLVADLEVVRPGMVLFAAGGPARYSGGEDALAEALVGVVADETGAECQVGVAEGYLTAVLAAREGVLVPPGRSREFLAGRDVRTLLHAATTREASAAWSDLVDLLRRLGLHTLGDVAGLRASDMAARFGELGSQAHRLAGGLDARRPAVHRPDPDITTSASLDPPAERIDTAAFTARRLAEELQNRLMRRGAVCARLQVSARTTTGRELVRTWRIEGALTASELTDRVRWQLEGWLGGRSGLTPSAPLARIELAAKEVSPAGAAQDGLWGRRARGEVQAGRAALRVQGILGPERVVVPVPEGGRTPRDRVRTVVWGDESPDRRRPDAPWPGQIPPPYPSIVPLEPRPVAVLTAAGVPVVVDARGQLQGDPAQLQVPVPARIPTVAPGAAPSPVDESAAGPTTAPSRGRSPRSTPPTLGWLRPGGYRITAWAGPWPVTERWWGQRRRGAWAQVETERGGVVLVCFREGSWWIEGVHD